VQKHNGIAEFRIKLYQTAEYTWCKFHYMVNQDADGNVVGLFGKILDSNENHLLKDEIKRNQDVIEILSSKDTVTMLENKTSFCQKFDKMLPTLNVSKNCCAIVSIDINGFSYINDNFGYDAGNDMLIEYANLISEQTFYILSSRIYSDYFYCLAYTNTPRDEFVEKVESINEKFGVQQKQKYPASEISICAGIYFINNNSLNSIICMDNCDLARRSIKNDKSTNICVYSEKLRDNRSREKVIPSELNDAITNEKIELFLHPKFDMKTFKIIGAEALSRWRNDDGSYRSPITFIPTLERLGYVVQLDFYIYEQVLKTMKRWKDNGISLIPISVNFSRVHNNHKNFVDRVLELADKYTIDRDLIEIEITESAFAESDLALLENIKRLRSLGFKIDIDDFGIGESSLSTLLDVPVDIIKLDKKFIDNLNESRRQQNFLKQLCLLIQTSNKHIIFEGVEQQNQADFLCDCGFYMAQGWLFDKAICVSEFEKKYIHDKKFS
jgi:diguanylate cyclase (GGDEF)-like protein